MRLIIIPPFKGMNWTPEKGQFMVRELVDNMKEQGQLEGVEVDIDDGYPFPAEIPVIGNNEFLAHIGVGVIKRVRHYSEMGKHDAIVQTGDLDPGFLGARLVSKIPYASAGHSAIHVASLIGDRFTFLATTDPCALIVRRMAENYGLSHKLASARHMSRRAAYVADFIRKYSKEERIKVPEVKETIDTITNQCVEAIEEDRVDSIILGCPAEQIFAGEVREQLNKLGYGEIPLICALSAAVEMAKVMVNMKLTQAPRAYPADELKAKPKFR